MASYCTRCKQQVHGRPQDQPHLCKDIAKRLARRERQVQAVLDIFDQSKTGLHVDAGRRCAEAIVVKLNQMGVIDD